jgi:hypothetical protein
MLRNEFELIRETEGYPSDLQRPYAKGDLAWIAIFAVYPAHQSLRESHR